MTDSSPNFYVASGQAKASNPRWRWLRYLLLVLLMNTGLWTVALLYLKVTPKTYISEWALLLPGSGVGSSVNLNNLGQASASVSSAYGGTGLDPRVNYKAIAESDTIVEQAARSLHLTVKEFGKPKIKLEEQTALMQFQVGGKTPQLAQQKSLALYQAFQAQLVRLRQNEITLRQQGAKAAIDEFKRQLEQAQRQLLNYQSDSGLVSLDQFKQLALNLEDLRKQRIELAAEQQKNGAQVRQLTANLGVSPQLAADAFILQADLRYQQLWRDYAEASTTLTVDLTKWDVNHPQVVAAQAKQEATRAALLERGRQLIRRGDETTLQLLNFSTDSNRAGLFRDLIAGYAQQQGTNQQAAELDRQLSQLNDRLLIETRRAARLGDLQRNLQVAETVFSTAIASSDVGKSNIYASYPLVQLLTQPSLPEEPSAPKPKFVLAGAALGSLFITASFILLWFRKPFVHKIFQSG